MSRAFYLNLAVDNLKKNARTIIPYILTSVLTTMMLYMVVSLANNPHLNEIVGGASIKQLLGFGTVIIEIFAFIFLYIKILVSEQGNTICEKTVEFSQIVDYEERQKGLS